MISDKESIKRITMARRVHAGVENAQVAAIEIAADARKQPFLVLDVDQHLCAFTDACQASAHDRSLTVDPAEKRSCVPPNVLRAVAKEVDDVELLPESIARFVR